MRLFSANANNRVIIIDKFNWLTNNAMNSMLKLLEEPPKGVYFFLIVDELINVLPTIQSRSQKLFFHNHNFSNCKKIINENSLLEKEKEEDIDNLVKILPPEECLENIYKIIDGYHLICKELRKFIEGSQKLYNQGKIPGVSRFLLLDYNAAISLQMASVTLLVIISNDPKYAHLSSKIPIEKIGFYLNRPMA